jgi:hypothetical protein
MKKIPFAPVILSILFLIASSSAAEPKKQNNNEDAERLKTLSTEFAKILIDEKDWNSYLDSFAEYVVKNASQNTAKRYGNISAAAQSLVKYYKKQAGWDFIIKKTAEAYAREFSSQEFTELIEFFRTPLGKKYLKAGLTIQRKTQQQFNQMISANEAAHRDAIKKALEQS